MVRVVEYDPAWPQHAAEAIAEVRQALPVIGSIEHIGSTSVPGLAAKPIIDLMAAVPALDHVAEPAVTALGYARLDTGMPNRIFFLRRAEDGSGHNLHIVPADTWETRNERILRDHLLTHPEALRQYAELKQALAQRGLDDDSYGRAKTELIQSLMDAARDERGLPRVPVWEE
jgi:GrpB-like predicted nucleotidyltransferase (UPF0157 family)